MHITSMVPHPWKAVLILLHAGMSFRPRWFWSVLIAKYRQFQGRSLINLWLPCTPGAVEQHLCSAPGLAPRLGNVSVGFFVVVLYMVMLVLALSTHIHF
jgi:hypothetical protein